MRTVQLSDWKSGTSMATPHVSGIAAMVWAQDLNQTNAQVRSSIETSAEEFGALGQTFRAWVQHGRAPFHNPPGSADS